MSQTTTRPGGRPRDPALNAAIEHAALRLVAEFGFDAVSMDRIAEAAGVSKPTIYRRWRTKADLVVGGIRNRMAQLELPDDTGSLRGDLLAVLGAELDELTRDDRLAVGVAAAMNAHPELAEVIQASAEALVVRRSRTVVARAIARGELNADAHMDDVDFVFHAAQALVLGRSVLDATPVDAAFLARAVDVLILPALLAAAGTSRSHLIHD